LLLSGQVVRNIFLNKKAGVNKLIFFFLRERENQLTNMEDEKKIFGCGPSSKVELPWVEQHRPTSLHEIVSHDHIVRILSKLLDYRNPPNLLLEGPAGCGKSSTIYAVARKMYGDFWKFMVLELNASDERGIEEVRKKIKEFASNGSLLPLKKGIPKLVILDEADQMTGAAQFALRRTMEKYVKNTRFCIITNCQRDIIPALQSRCAKFHYGPLREEEMVTRLQDISRKQGFDLKTEHALLIGNLVDGDMRQAVTLLQTVCTIYGENINENTIYICAGKPSVVDMSALFEYLTSPTTSLSSSLSLLDWMRREKGYSLIDILSSLHGLLFPLPEKKRWSIGPLLEGLAQVEYRLSLSQGMTDEIQAGAVASLFFVHKEKERKIT
jgi:replication factor C subunit 3/5